MAHLRPDALELNGVQQRLSSNSGGARSAAPVAVVCGEHDAATRMEVVDIWSSTDWAWDAYTMLGAQQAPGEGGDGALQPAVAPRSVELNTGAGMNALQAGGKRPWLCQVRGCAQALDTTAIAKRYRVCAMHLAAERVVVDSGSPERYCRTCTRFHPLEAFNGAKRTCARQLTAQTVRYRKRQADRVATAGTAPAAHPPAPELPQLHATEAQQPSLPVTLPNDMHAPQKCTKLEPLCAFQDARHTCIRKLVFKRTGRREAVWKDERRVTWPERSANDSESYGDEAAGAGAEGSYDTLCMQRDSISKTLLWSAGPTLCDACETLYAFDLPGVLQPPPLLLPELVGTPHASMAVHAGGIAELDGAPLRLSEEWAVVATPQLPSVSSPQQLALGPAPPVVPAPAVLPVVQPSAAMLPLMEQMLVAVLAPPALPFALPQMITPPTPISIAAAAEAHARVAEARAAKARLQAARVYAALFSVPVLNPQLQQLLIAGVQLPLNAQLEAARRAAAATTTTAQLQQQQLEEQQRIEREAHVQAEVKAAREAAAREEAECKMVEAALASEAVHFSDVPAAEDFHWLCQAPSPSPTQSHE